ncbi:hypothetical protein DFH07DRAFT_772610 [Mycena maculata]|uniref:Uncharacterized protein n=1 Tax=Mycena maculata TaxID=230809 RepID=A0AAD7NE27_9AGAR|nr:hypothetical protein DFH07DRAFT_772610 [Mycena maculata]
MIAPDCEAHTHTSECSSDVHDSYMDTTFRDILQYEQDQVPAEYKELYNSLHESLCNYDTVSLEQYRQIDSNTSLTGMHRTFYQRFRGNHDTILLDTLDYYYNTSRETLTAMNAGDQPNPDTFYSLTLPFVQSSCMGKSRTAYEAVKKRFGFNICLREAVPDLIVYPLADDQVRDYLTLKTPEGSNTLGSVSIRYYLFLAELFGHAVKTLQSEDFLRYKNGNADKSLSENWFSWFELGADSQQHGPNRIAFYDKVIKNATSRLNKVISSDRAQFKCSAAAKLLVQTLSQYDVAIRHTRHSHFANRSLIPVDTVIFFDEAHSLSALTVEDPDDRDNRRTGLLTPHSSKSFQEGLATPAICHPSMRGSHDYRLFPPLSEFVGFDLFASDVMKSVFQNGVSIDRLCEPRLMVGFGRPYWYGHWNSLDEDDRSKINTILSFAFRKLFPH